MVYSFPSNEALWHRYTELWVEGQRNGTGIKAATEFYREHREAMDEGAVVAWPVRFNPDEFSAVQHAMNLKLERGEAAFWAEYQNEPLPEDMPDDDLLTADQIAVKVNGHKCGEVPIGCTHLTMFIDVQAKALFWLVAAWEDNFTGYVVDYGTEPDQKAAHFTLREIRRTLARAAPRAGLEGSIYAGLERLTERTVGKEWRRDDGAMVRIDRCLIDANWGQSSDVVFDTNYWKSFVHARLDVAMGDPGCLLLFGRKAEQHRLLAEHLTSEYRVKTQGRGRTVDEWKLRVDGLDNHWLDCLVGSAVAASMQGAALFGTDAKPAPKRRIRLSELQGAKR